MQSELIGRANTGLLRPLQMPDLPELFSSEQENASKINCVDFVTK